MLRWNYYGGKYKPDGFSDTHFGEFSQNGTFYLRCSHNGRRYKDGTLQYKVYLSVPNADSSDVITLTKVRGYLADAQAKAEEFAKSLLGALTVLQKEETGYDNDLFIKAVSYYSADVATDILNDFVKRHADEYIYGYQHCKDLLDIDFWCRYEELLGEKLTWDEYVNLDNYVDGSPEDISSDDGIVMKTLKDRLAAFRKQNRVDALLIEISNLHHEIQGVIAYDEDKAEDIKKRLLEVLNEFHELAPKDHIYHQMCDNYGFEVKK